MYITKAASISYQDSFQNEALVEDLKTISKENALIEPDYDHIIDASALRRMSSVVKMAVASALECINQKELNPEAIIVGSAHGCPYNTKRFLQSIHTRKGKLLSPTPFMLSTHNSIAGQISLLTKNHCYNITHTQNSLSFEHALIDAQMLMEEGVEEILVGSSDELENDIYDHNLKLNNLLLVNGEGASFFLLRKHEHEKSSPEIKDIAAITFVEDLKLTIEQFLQKHQLNISDITTAVYSSSNETNKKLIQRSFSNSLLYDLHQYAHSYLTSSSLGLHIAYSQLKKTPHKYALVINNIITENLGLILIKQNHVVG